MTLGVETSSKINNFIHKVGQIIFINVATTEGQI